MCFMPVTDPKTVKALELASPAAARAYLAHLMLRQVDWSPRFHPDTPATRRHCAWRGWSSPTSRRSMRDIRDHAGLGPETNAEAR